MKKINQKVLGLASLGLLLGVGVVFQMSPASGAKNSGFHADSDSEKADSKPSPRADSLEEGVSTATPKEARMSAAEFSELTHQTLLSLPLLADLQKLSASEAHDTPRVLVDAALKVGTIVEEAEKNPEFQSMALDFYQRCALGDYSVSLRATCFQLLRKSDPTIAESLDLPSYVIRLADAE